MEVSVTKESLDEQYPGLADRMLAALDDKLRKKEREAGHVAFKLSYAVAIGPERRRAEEGNEAVRMRWIEDAVSWSLIASAGHFKVSARPGHGLPEASLTPHEIIANELARFGTADRERARVAGLTPDQRQAELDEALRQLRGQPGFAEFQFRGPPADGMADAFRDAPPVMNGTDFIARLKRGLGSTDKQPDQEDDEPTPPGRGF